MYAVLPILRGTITGIQGVPAAVVECAVAMGLTPRQVLRQVEWPLALPSIVSGLRVAVVIGVGTATIASAIGAGGLGDYIFRGLAMVDSHGDPRRRACRRRCWRSLADGALALAGTRGRSAPAIAARRRRSLVGAVARRARRRAGGPPARRRARDVVVGSKNFTEQVVLGEMLAQTIERQTGLTVERRLNLGGTAIAHEALLSGGIDVVCRVHGHGADRDLQRAAVDRFEPRSSRSVRDRYAALGADAAAAARLQQHVRDPRAGERRRQRLGLKTGRAIWRTAAGAGAGRRDSATSSSSGPTASRA